MCEMWWWCQTFSLTAFSGLWHWCFRGVACRACWGHWFVTCREQAVCQRLNDARNIVLLDREEHGQVASSARCWHVMRCVEYFCPERGLNIQQIVIWLSYLLQFVRQKVAGSAEYRLLVEWLHKQRTARSSKTSTLDTVLLQLEELSGLIHLNAADSGKYILSRHSFCWCRCRVPHPVPESKKFRQLNGTIFLQVRINLQNTV